MRRCGCGWGAAGRREGDGWTGAVSLEVWRDYAEDVTGTVIEQCGRFLAEERPDRILDELRTFLPAAV